MGLTSRREFVKGAAASCIALANIEARGFDNGDAAGLPNPIFAYEFGDISPEQQATFAREYGFEGTVFDHARQIPERLASSGRCASPVVLPLVDRRYQQWRDQV